MERDILKYLLGDRRRVTNDQQHINITSYIRHPLDYWGQNIKILMIISRHNDTRKNLNVKCIIQYITDGPYEEMICLIS